MATSDFQNELVRLAHDLRPLGNRSASVLEIAHELGTSVWLRVHTGSSSPTAQIDLAHRPPKIILYRAGKLNGERQISQGEDGLLTSRERFSIAHELGHWIALSRLNVRPQSDPSKYWDQENAINAFAGSLLAPDWLVIEWLKRTPEGSPVLPTDLEVWASSQCRTSEEVVAKALVRRRRSIGFLKTVFAQNAKGIDVLKVLYSATGEDLSLPHRASHIQEPRLLKLLRADASGSTSIPDLSLGNHSPANLHLSWRRTGPSKRTAWLSFSRPALCGTCETPLFRIAAHFDPALPYSAFCSPSCRGEAIAALGEGVGCGSEERFKKLEPAE